VTVFCMRAAGGGRQCALAACRTVSAIMVIVVTVTTVLGCTGLGPVQPMSGGTWHVDYHTGWGRYDETEEMNRAMKAASDYCLGRGQNMDVIDTQSRPGGLRMSYASVHFRCTPETSDH
jgi:hypothetical protein